MTDQDESQLPEFLRDSDALGADRVDVLLEREAKAALAAPRKAIPEKMTWQQLEKLRKDTEAWMEANPGKFNMALIRDMQKCGMQRPEWIKCVDWNQGVRDMGPAHHLVCYMAAYGIPNGEIASKLNRAQRWVSDFLATQDAKTVIAELQLRVFGMEPKKWIEKTIMPMAIQTALDIMNDKEVKAQTRLNAAIRFMDHGLGKPKQEIEVHDSTVRQLIEKLDAIDRQTGGRLMAEDVIDVSPEGAVTVKEPEPKLSEPVLDAVDQWTKENLHA